MSEEKHILMIGTNGIDCFFGLSQNFDKNQIRVVQVHSHSMAKVYLSERKFDAVIVNLEPDGDNGIHGFSLLPYIVDIEQQHDAVCFAVSVESASKLLSASVENMKYLGIIAGWLTLPINHEKAANIIIEVMNKPGALTIKNRIPKIFE